MPDRTITLARLEADPTLYRRLKVTRRLHSTLTALAADLERSRRGWLESLTRAEHDPATAAATATELALADLETAIARLRASVLPDAPVTDGEGGPTLEEAMAFLRRHTPPE